MFVAFVVGGLVDAAEVADVSHLFSPVVCFSLKKPQILKTILRNFTAGCLHVVINITTSTLRIRF